MDAQLGQQANISLGGYIPAAAKQPKLWQQVLAQFLGNMAGQAGSAVVSQVLPGAQEKLAREDLALRRELGGRGATVAERGATVAERGASVSEATGAAGIRQGDKKLAQGDEQLKLASGELALKGADFARQQTADDNRVNLALAELDLARDRFKQSGSQFDRDLLLRKEKLVADMLGQSFDQNISIGKLGLGAAESERENALLPARQKALEAQAGSREAYAEQSGAKTEAMQQQARDMARIFKVNQIRQRTDLSDAQKRQLINQFLSEQR